MRTIINRESFSSTACPVSPANIAIRAAKMRRNVGRYASTQYAVKRGVTMRLYRLCCQLEAAQRAGIK